MEENWSAEQKLKTEKQRKNNENNIGSFNLKRSIKLTKLTKKKRKRYQLPKSGVKEEASLLTLQNNYEKVYATQLDNLEEMDNS